MNLNFLKGVLIILVIADHNEFTRSLFPEFFRGLTFHVVGFMTIPFLRPPMQVASRAFADYAFRLYYPFLLLVCALWLVVTVSEGGPVAQRLGLLAAVLYSGNADLLKQVLHIGLLWFLPSFLALVTIRNLIDTSGARLRQAAWVLLLVAHLWVGMVAPALQDYLPLGLLPALYMIPLGYAGVALHRKLFEPMGAGRALLLSTLVFAAVKALQMHLQLNNEVGFAQVADVRHLGALLVNDLEAVSGTLMLFQAARLHFQGVIAACGKVSMQIYLFHAFIALGVYRVLMLTMGQVHPAWLFVLSMGATIAITLAAAMLVMRVALLRRLLFPRSLDELRGVSAPAAASLPR